MILIFKSFIIFLSMGFYKISASEIFDINFGPNKIKLNLIRSKALIAVKPNPQEKEKNIALILNQKGIKVEDTHKNLAGFQILKLQHILEKDKEFLDVKKKRESDTLSNILPKETKEKSTLSRIQKLNSVLSVSHVYHTSSDDLTPFVPTGQIYIKFFQMQIIRNVRK